MKPPVDTAQTAWELDQLLALTGDARSVLEVGIWEGGTLWHWLQQADRVVAIDDTMRPPGPEVWQQWADAAECSLTLLQGRSQWPPIIEQAGCLGPYDLVFIDADHSYESVAQDWANYRSMLAPGGVVVFHDITPRPDYGVSELWNQVKGIGGARWVEIVENSGRFNGIGLIWLP